MQRAYGAGLSIDEVDRITPAHTLFYLDSVQRKNVRDAWIQAYLFALAKTKDFPKDPENLPFWPKPKDNLEAVEAAYARLTAALGR